MELILIWGAILGIIFSAMGFVKAYDIYSDVKCTAYVQESGYQK